MSGNIETHVIERFLAKYGEPKHTNPEDFMGEYVKALYGTPTDVLIPAMDLVEYEHQGPIWPGIRACRTAINEAKAGKRAPQQRASYSEIPNNSRRPIAKPAAISLDGKSIEEILAENRAVMAEIDARRKNSRPVTLPRVDRDAWQMRHKGRAA